MLKTLTTLCALALAASMAMAQDEWDVKPSAESQRYNAFRAESTDPVQALAKVKAMIAKQADIKTSRETATDDNKDRFINRGKYARA